LKAKVKYEKTFANATAENKSKINQVYETAESFLKTQYEKYKKRLGVFSIILLLNLLFSF